MINELVLLSEATESAISSFLQNPRHAMLLEAEMHAGGEHLLRVISEASVFGDHPEIHWLGSSPGTIKIDEIKRLKLYTKLQTPQGTARLVMCDRVERMTREAQNSLLKLLEEPPERTFFLFRTTDRQLVLQTIISRMTIIRVSRPSKESFETYFAKYGLSSEDLQKLYMRSGGLVGAACALIESTGQSEGLEDAKAFLSDSPAIKITRLDTLNKQPDYCNQLLDNCLVLLQAGLHSAAQKGNDVSRWLSMISAIEQAQTELRIGVGRRASLTKLLLSL